MARAMRFCANLLFILTGLLVAITLLLKYQRVDKLPSNKNPPQSRSRPLLNPSSVSESAEMAVLARKMNDLSSRFDDLARQTAELSKTRSKLAAEQERSFKAVQSHIDNIKSTIDKGVGDAKVITGVDSIRDDGLCGPKYPAPSGNPGECDPVGKMACCNAETGRCGGGTEDCDCDDCIDFSLLYAARHPHKTWRDDGRCGANFPLENGKPSECNPHADADQKGPCCRLDSGWCGNERGTEWGHCDCGYNCMLDVMSITKSLYPKHDINCAFSFLFLGVDYSTRIKL